jgi:16S rRNA (uracil1498-N3)-methyltransferase
MTRRRWIADEYSEERAVLTGAHAAHLSRALRAQVGQEFEVACGEVVRRAVISSVSDERVEFILHAAVASRPFVPITLLLAIFKFDRMEWAIEKCTELNVTAIIPVIARRTEKHLALAAARRVERWRRIARQASEQSRRVAPPEIAGPAKLADALQANADLRVVLAENEREAEFGDVLRAHRELTSLALAVGSEGGWTAEELHSFESSQWIAASLGETILRAETAAIAALAVARAETSLA